MCAHGGRAAVGSRGTEDPDDRSGASERMALIGEAAPLVGLRRQRGAGWPPPGSSPGRWCPWPEDRRSGGSIPSGGRRSKAADPSGALGGRQGGMGSGARAGPAAVAGGPDGPRQVHPVSGRARAGAPRSGSLAGVGPRGVSFGGGRHERARVMVIAPRGSWWLGMARLAQRKSREAGTGAPRVRGSTRSAVRFTTSWAASTLPRTRSTGACLATWRQRSQAPNEKITFT